MSQPDLVKFLTILQNNKKVIADISGNGITESKLEQFITLLKNNKEKVSNILQRAAVAAAEPSSARPAALAASARPASKPPSARPASKPASTNTSTATAQQPHVAPYTISIGNFKNIALKPRTPEDTHDLDETELAFIGSLLVGSQQLKIQDEDWKKFFIALSKNKECRSLTGTQLRKNCGDVSSVILDLLDNAGKKGNVAAAKPEGDKEETPAANKQPAAAPAAGAPAPAAAEGNSAKGSASVAKITKKPNGKVANGNNRKQPLTVAQRGQQGANEVLENAEMKKRLQEEEDKKKIQAARNSATLQVQQRAAAAAAAKKTPGT